jgi:hypothetical protein
MELATQLQAVNSASHYGGFHRWGTPITDGLLWKILY